MESQPDRPEGCRQRGEGRKLRLEIDWYDAGAYILVGMGVVFSFPVAGWFYVGPSINHPAWYGFGAVFAAFVGFMFYGAAVKLKNHTAIFFDGDQLRSTIGPLPFPGGTSVNVRGLETITVKVVVSGRSHGSQRKGRGPPPSYEVRGQDAAGNDQVLVSALATKEQAEWAATCLRQALDLAAA